MQERLFVIDQQTDKKDINKDDIIQTDNATTRYIQVMS